MAAYVVTYFICSFPNFNRPTSQIPDCTGFISHNAPFRTEMCTFLFWMEHLWDIEQVHSGICELGQLNLRRCDCMAAWRGDGPGNGCQVSCSIALRWRHNERDGVAFQITSPAIVHSTVYSDADQENQSSVSLAFVRGNHRGPASIARNVSISRRHHGMCNVSLM